MHISEPASRTLSFIGALLLLLIGSVAGYLIGDLKLAILIDTGILFAIFLLRKIFDPPWSEHSQIRILILGIFATAASTFGLWDSIVPVIVGWLFSKFGLSAPEFPTIWQQIIIMGIVGTVLVFIVKAFERKQILPHPTGQPITDPSETFPKVDYRELRDRFCDFMVGELDRIDVELNWSDSDFTILEAEVVVEKGGSSRPKIARDLVAAIRDDHKTRTFILIGDPGSGKSVSLRRLARELYKRVPETGIVPLYINLREWDGPREPTDSDIVEFISSYLLRVSGRAGQSFLKNWYEPMLLQGLFFFLLDSFDEMPVVMDCDDRSSELKIISEAFDRFFHDIHHCRGVLSSRPFRQPVGVRGRRLNVKPFTETQIRKAMKKWLKGWSIDADSIIRKIFIERPELAPAIRNPFMADLISQYVINFPDKLPSTYYELYEHYISKRLNDSIDYIKQLGLSTEAVISAATQISWTMYNTSDIGLEIESSKLETLMGDSRLSDEIKAMSFSRIARLGGIGRDRFTFVHRRFAEFFAVRSIHENNMKVDLTSIPTDSRWRDALVVYSGIAPVDRVQELATFSWLTIKENSEALIAGDFQKAMPAIHSLRFLRDSCQSRPEGLITFVDELSDLVVKLIKSKDLLVAKIATEALPLITPEARTKGIELAFERGITWLSEAALRSCRHLAKLENSIISRVQEYTRKLPTIDLILSLHNLNFSLSLSDSLRMVRIDLWLQIISLTIIWTYLVLASFLSPVNPFIILTGAMFFELIWIRESSDTIRRTISSPFQEIMRLLVGELRSGLDTSVRMTLFLIAFAPFFVIAMNVLMPQVSDEPIKLDSDFIYYILIAIPINVWFSLLYNPKRYTENLLVVFRKSINIRNLTVNILIFAGTFIVIGLLFRIKYIYEVLIIVVGIFFVVGAAYSIFSSSKSLITWVRELKDVNQISREDNVTWSMLCQTASKFQTDWGQARYFEFIREHKINVLDYAYKTQQPAIRGSKSEQQFARLREQVLELQE